MSGQPASAFTVVGAIAELTLRRLWRGRALWVSVVIAMLPVAFAAILRSQGSAGDVRQLASSLLVFEGLLLAVIPAMFIAASIGEEIEDRTTTYLWSRALPRWTIIVGKLVALVPVILLLLLGNWFLGTSVGGTQSGVMPYVALAGAATAVSLLAAGLATLVPKHGMALTICYVLFFDLPVGALPASIREASITQHFRSLAELSWAPDDPRALSLLGLALLGGFWLTLALARIRRIES